MKEGYIKFNCQWEQREIQIRDEIFIKLESERTKLHELGLIGMYPDGIGFGNISAKLEGSSFIITGSATGQFDHLHRSQFALVTGYNFEYNSVTCAGLTRASAESLTHAAVYEALPDVHAVVHVHCLWLWELLRDEYPTTSIEIEYGTPEMAYAVQKLASNMKMNQERIFVLGGHREGILTFGSTLEDATSQIIHVFNNYKND